MIVNLEFGNNKKHNYKKEETIVMKKSSIIRGTKFVTRTLVGTGVSLITQAYMKNITGLNEIGKISVGLAQVAASGCMTMHLGKYTDQVIDELVDIIESI